MLVRRRCAICAEQGINSHGTGVARRTNMLPSETQSTRWFVRARNRQRERATVEMTYRQ